MKKIMTLLFALCLCILFCSCSTNKENQSSIIADHTDAAYVGVWTMSDNKYGDAFPTTIQLLSNGKALLLNTDAYAIQDAPWAFAGEWMIEDDSIIVFYEYDGSEDFPYDQAYIFRIESETKIKLSKLELTYTKE